MPAAPGEDFPARSEIEGLKYISDQSVFVDDLSEELTPSQRKALDFAKSVLSLYLGAEIRGHFTIAEADWGYQINFTRIETKQDGEWTESVRGFGEVFLSTCFSRIQIDYGS